MVRATICLQVIENFPPGTPLLIIAPAAAGYTEIAMASKNPAVVTCVLDPENGSWAHEAASTTPHVLLDGIDELDDPVTFLKDLRARAPEARMFALIANACNLIILERFYSEAVTIAAHPLVADQIPDLFEHAGWNVATVTEIMDDLIPANLPAPFPAQIGNIQFQIKDDEMRDRTRVAAFLVVADR